MELTWDHEIIYTPWIYQELWQIKAFLLGFPNLKTDIMNLCGDWPRSNHIYPIGSIWLGIFTYESTIKDSTKYMYFNSYKSTYNHPHGSPKTPGYIYIYTKTPFPNPKENKTHPGGLAVTGGWMNLLPSSRFGAFTRIGSEETQAAHRRGGRKSTTTTTSF